MRYVYIDKLYNDLMVEILLHCDKCKDKTIFSYVVCPECGGIYYQCNECKIENRKVPEDDNDTFKKSCDLLH